LAEPNSTDIYRYQTHATLNRQRPNSPEYKHTTPKLVLKKKEQKVTELSSVGQNKRKPFASRETTGELSARNQKKETQKTFSIKHGKQKRSKPRKFRKIRKVEDESVRNEPDTKLE